MIVGGGSGEIERRGAFGVQNRKPGRPGSMFVWGAQKNTGFVKEVHLEGQVRWLRSRVHAIAQEARGDT